jgi:uncharacterized protein (TIGR03000 family)
LYIDNKLMPQKSGQRFFVTPELQPGQTYYYDVKLVVNNGGTQEVQTTRVLLRPGQDVAATFTGQNTAGIAVAGQKP